MDSSLIRVRQMRPLARPSSLKDHLFLDDMSSCSSNGFKSFPRRSHCCTTVRFLHNLNRKTPQERIRYKNFRKPSQKSALSAFTGLFSAVKRLPFAAGPPGKMKLRGPSFARSFSRKISGFWKRKKSEKEVIGRWRSSDQVMKDESEAFGESDDGLGDIKSDSWSSGSDFTVSDDFFSSGKYSSSEVHSNSPEKENDVVKYGESVPEKVDVSTESNISRDDSGALTNSTANSTKWTSSDGQEKEHFSPVSVLDCPFDEEEDEVSSRVQRRLAHVEGTKAKLMKKIETLEGLAKLEPVNLETKFKLHLDSDHKYSSVTCGSSPPIDEKSLSGAEDEEDEDEVRALEILMHQTKDTHLPSQDSKVEFLVLDFFQEKIAGNRANSREGNCGPSFEKGLVEEARDWINGGKGRHEYFGEWEVEKGRRAYVYDMEKRGEWGKLDEERDEVALEMENVLFVELMDELMREISI